MAYPIQNLRAIISAQAITWMTFPDQIFQSNNSSNITLQTISFKTICQRAAKHFHLVMGLILVLLQVHPFLEGLGLTFWEGPQIQFRLGLRKLENLWNENYRTWQTMTWAAQLNHTDCQRLASNQIGFANNYSKSPVNIGCFHKYGQIKNYMKLSWQFRRYHKKAKIFTFYS